MSCKEEHKHKPKPKPKPKHKHVHKDHHHDNHCENECKCKDKSCKRSHKLVKECVCNEWSVPNGQTQTVFLSEGFQQIFASGFISFDCGNAPFVTARFFDGNDQVGPDLRVFQDSSVSFITTRFNRITVTCANDSDEFEFTGNDDCSDDCPNACEGELCIRTRFPIDMHDKHSDY